MEPTHPDRLVENVTAPSAGGSPDPDGAVRLRMRLPFRTTASFKSRLAIRLLQASNLATACADQTCHAIGSTPARTGCP
jgi:hypothetical protein